jgi:hypothetical protein
MNTSLGILNGWKEIAGYLGTSIRSVQRYEHLGKLPIHRPTDRSRGPVFATKPELDAWVDGKDQMKHPFRVKPTLLQDRAVISAAFKTGLAEHRRLRKRMTTGREELYRALELLRLTICAVQEESAEKFENLARSRGALLRIP